MVVRIIIDYEEFVARLMPSQIDLKVSILADILTQTYEELLELHLFTLRIRRDEFKKILFMRLLRKVRNHWEDSVHDITVMDEQAKQIEQQMAQDAPEHSLNWQPLSSEGQLRNISEQLARPAASIGAIQKFADLTAAE